MFYVQYNIPTAAQCCNGSELCGTIPNSSINAQNNYMCGLKCEDCIFVFTVCAVALYEL